MVFFCPVLLGVLAHATHTKFGFGFDYKTGSVMLALDDQSPNIAASVHLNRNEDWMHSGGILRYTTAKTTATADWSNTSRPPRICCWAPKIKETVAVLKRYDLSKNQSACPGRNFVRHQSIQLIGTLFADGPDGR